MSYYSEPQNDQKYNPAPPAYTPGEQQFQPGYAPPAYAPTPYYPAPPMQQTANTIVITRQQPNPTCTSTLMGMRNPPNDHMVFSVLTCLFCFWPTSIIALIYSCEVNDRYNAGDHAGAMESSRKAYQWGKISLIIGTISYVMSSVFFFVAVVILTVSSAAVTPYN